MSRSVAVLCVLFAAFSEGYAFGPEIRWMPVGASEEVICMPGQGDCGDNEILLRGGGVTVTLFLQVDGWDPDDDGDPLLGAFQGTLDATTYEGGLTPGVAHADHPGNPGSVAGCDLMTRGFDVGDCEAGIFQAVKICTSDMADPIGNADWLSDCTLDPGVCPPFPGGCIDRPDWLFKGVDYDSELSCASEDYVLNAVSFDCKDDADEFPAYYGGTLVVEVPECARGTYNVDFVRDDNFTLFNRCDGWLIPDLTPVWAQITIQMGRCCYGIGHPLGGCVDDVTEADCDALRIEFPVCTLFDPGETCADSCCYCISDIACRESGSTGPGGDDLCTDNWCECCRCQTAPNYAVGIECCDPGTGHVVIIDDGDDCTIDWCDGETGQVIPIPQWGKCCHGFGEPSGIQCESRMTEMSCDNLDGFTVWTACVDCTGDIVTDCPGCTEAMCDDGDPCTEDICNPDTGNCTNPLAYAPGGECCAPSTGGIGVINDGDPCTIDTCDPATGQVSNERVAPVGDCCVPFGSRYLAMSPDPTESDPVALLVTGDPGDARVSCVSRYVQEDGTLGVDPVFRMPDVWGTMAVRGDEIIPSTTYYVQIDDGTALSDPMELTTWAWADVNNDTYVNITDVQLILLGIAGEFLWASRPNLDLIGTLGETCTPQTILNVTDIQMALLCIAGDSYADLGCPVVCP